MARIAKGSRDRKASPSRDSQSRRDAIVYALELCIRDRGFTKTTLTDIAVAAGMSPSHIRYYFDGKDALLEYFLDLTCRRIVEGIRSIDTSDPDVWFREFTGWFIGHPRITPARLSVMIEIFGISVHDPALRAIKTRYDDEIRAILEGYFERVGCAQGLTPRVAAEVAQALEAGLKYNSVFQDGFSAAHAEEVFLAGLNHLVGKRG